MKDSLIWLRRFVMLYGIIMICTFLMCLLFNPGAELPVVSFFGKIMVFSLIGLDSINGVGNIIVSVIGACAVLFVVKKFAK